MSYITEEAFLHDAFDSYYTLPKIVDIMVCANSTEAIEHCFNKFFSDLCDSVFDPQMIETNDGIKEYAFSLHNNNPFAFMSEVIREISFRCNNVTVSVTAGRIHHTDTYSAGVLVDQDATDESMYYGFEYVNDYLYSTVDPIDVVTYVDGLVSLQLVKIESHRTEDHKAQIVLLPSECVPGTQISISEAFGIAM